MDRPYILFASNTTGFRVGRIMHGVLQECHQAKLGLLWRESDRCDLAGLRRRPLGVIVWDKLAAIQNLLGRLGNTIPVVSTIGHTLNLPLPTVVPDPVSISRQVATHLIAEGLRSFVFVGARTNPAARLRADAFAAELQRQLGSAQLTFFNADLEDRFWGPDTGRGKAFVRLLTRSTPPLGIFAFNDQIAASCMECAESAGLNVPRQIAIVGVDDHPIFTKMYQPLSSVQVDYEAIGRKAVSLILTLQAPGVRRRLPLHHFVSGELIVRQSSRPRLLGDERISQALHFLHDHYAEHVTLEELARKVGMSRASFSLRFHHAVGQAPIRYLINLRLSQARLLLAESTLTVAEIAYRVGFEDQGYFTRAFKKHFDTTPKTHRKTATVPVREA